MKGFFNELLPKIQEAVVKDYQEILRQVGGEKIYAAVLGTDSDCITLGLNVNTVEHMTKTDIGYGYHDKEAYIEKWGKYMPPEEIEWLKHKNSPIESTKWQPGEWGYFSAEPGGTVDISSLLFAKSMAICDELDDLPEDEFDKIYDEFVVLFMETVTAAFVHLIQNNAFGLDPGEATYFIHMTDDNRAVGIAKESAKRLNSAEVYEQFLKESGLDKLEEGAF